MDKGETRREEHNNPAKGDVDQGAGSVAERDDRGGGTAVQEREPARETTDQRTETKQG